MSEDTDNSHAASEAPSIGSNAEYYSDSVMPDSQSVLSVGDEESSANFDGPICDESVKQHFPHVGMAIW